MLGQLVKYKSSKMCTENREKADRSIILNQFFNQNLLSGLELHCFFSSYQETHLPLALK